MESVAGIFDSRRDAEQAFSELKKNSNFDRDGLLFLTPDTSQDKIDEVPTDEGEQPGMGATIGGVVGGAMGLATGAALSNLVFPGVGPILTLGLSATGGLGGAVLGATGGGATERALSNGLPKDEMFFYEDALRCGRSVVIANAESENVADAARAIMEHNHADSVDAARERWWIGIREREADRYCADTPQDTAERERVFRSGFEAALQSDMRNKPLNKAGKRLRERHPDICEDEIFRRGYERGRRHLRTFQKNGASDAAKRSR
jgi:hypothetical protein